MTPSGSGCFRGSQQRSLAAACRHFLHRLDLTVAHQQGTIKIVHGRANMAGKEVKRLADLRPRRIACDGDALRWAGLSLDLPMVHRHHDVFETVPDRMAGFGNWSVQFATGVEGHVESLTGPLEPAVAPIVFCRPR